MNETRQLAQFVTQLSYQDLPREVIDKTKDLILDQFGVQLAASTKPWSRAVYRLMRDLGGKAESTVVYYGDKLPAMNAAFANGTFGHGFESDDSLRRAGIHPGCVVVSAAMAIGERELVDGKTLLLAAAIGFEVLGRIGLATVPSIMRRGHHPTCTIGSIAAAAITGKMLGFDAETMAHALSLGAGGAAGLVVSTGGSQKRTYGGMGASNGIRAALLAQAGITGSPTAIEEDLGFGTAFSDTFTPGEITKELGREYRLLEIIHKYYSADGHVHPMIDAAARIMERRPIAPNEIEDGVIGCSRFIASRSVVRAAEPADMTTAQFSGSFSVALRMVKGGNSFEHYTEENLHDPEVVRLASKIRVVEDPEIEKGFPVKRGARLTLKLKDGSVLEEVVDDIRAISSPEVVGKFRHLAGLALPQDRVDAITETVRSLESVGSLSTLAAMLIR